MRIAFYHNLPPGGAKRSAYEFVRRMVLQHTVDLYYIDPASEEYLDLRPLVNRALFTPAPPPSSTLTNLASGDAGLQKVHRQIAAQINGGEYDLAFVMQCKLCNTPYLLKYLRIPSLYFCHEPSARMLEPQHEIKGRFAALKRRAVQQRVSQDRENARCATVICANSRYSVESIYRAYGVYPRYCPMGVDVEKFRPLNLQHRQEVLAVGSLTVAKAQDFIVQSVGALAERPPVRFVFNFEHVVSQRMLQQMAQELGVEVAFSQLLSDEDLVTAYNSAAVVAFPSILEPFGLIPIEAMACATPVVGVAEGGIRETIIDGETGFLTERDPLEFGQAIQRLMKNPELRQSMGARGREHVVQHWSWEHAYAVLENNMCRAVERARQTPNAQETATSL